MLDICYLDNSATTPPCRESIEAVNKSLCENWGNPSSLYLLGFNAEQCISQCKAKIAGRLSCREDEIFFTSGGTEANNLALRGAAAARRKRGKRIVTTAFEHPSVLETVKSLEGEGFEAVYLKPDSTGHISKETIREAITTDTVLVSIMLVNNEIGTIQNLRAAAERIREVSAPALLHTDAVQGFGKLAVKPSALGVDLLSASGHKIHGPKGIGFLYIKKGVHILPIVTGGGQQNGIRSGTEPTPLIAGLSGAISALPDTEQELHKIRLLRDYAEERLMGTGIIEINSPNDALPYILNASAVGYRSETMLHFLESKGIFVSSGSACSKGALSNTLAAIGFPRSRIDSALRLSFSRFTNKDDIDRLCEALEEAAKKLRRTK